jgi:site-specific DNA recombinase
MTTETAVRRVVTYERVSSEDQRERETIKTQRDALLRDAEAHRFNELWVYRLDRLGRDLVDMAIIGRRLRQLGIRLISMTEGEPDPFMFDIMAVVAENEKRVFLQRTADGINSAAGEGQYCGGIVPFGYQVRGARESARLEPDTSLLWADQSAAGIVRWIYERLGIDCWSCRRVADELNARGVPTHYAHDGRLVKRDNRKQHTQGVWRSGRIRNLVVNPVYRGELQYGRRTRKPRRDRDVISAPVEALVSPALWHAAQETLTANRSIAKNTRRRYLLRGVIHCGIDGLSYCGTQGRGEVGWYRCTGQMVERGPLPGRCWGQSIRTDAIEPLIWADIERWLRNPGDILDELDGRGERDAQGTVAAAESMTLARALDGLEEQRRRALALGIRGQLSDAELDVELARIAREKAELEARVVALTPQAAPGAAEVAMDALTALRARLDAGLSEEERQEIVRLLVRITIHTETPVDGGRKAARAIVEYRFPAVVETSTGTGSWPRRAGSGPASPPIRPPARWRSFPPRAAGAEPRALPGRTRAARRGTGRRDGTACANNTRLGQGWRWLA